MSHFECRFLDMKDLVLKVLAVVPDVLIRDSSKHKPLIKGLVEFYKDDLPCPNDININAELRLWECKWKAFSLEKLPDTPQATLLVTSKGQFPNIYCLLQLLCTLPVTTCECESSVSSLRRLKTYMRSTMVEDRLSNLALMHIHYDQTIDVDEVVNIFARRHPRKIAL